MNEKLLKELEDSEFSFCDILHTLKTYEIYKKFGMLDDLEDEYKETKKYFIEIYAELFNLDKKKVKYSQAYKWLEKREAKNLLTELVQNEISILNGTNILSDYLDKYDEIDNFFLDNIEQLIDIMYYQVRKVIESYDSSYEKITKIDESKFEELVINILDSFDSTHMMTIKYLEAKKAGKIINIDLEDYEKLEQMQKEIDESITGDFQCVCADSGNYIITSFTHTLYDVVAFCHEFAHYLDASNQHNTILEEYTSTLLELYAKEYLKEEGYSNSVINTIQNIRDDNTILSYVDCLIILNIIKDFIKNNYNDNYDINTGIEETSKEYKELRKILPEEVLLDCEDIVPGCFTSEEIKDFDIINHGIFKLTDVDEYFGNEYKYVVGHFLADRTLKLLKENKLTKEELVYLVFNIYSINPYDIFKMLDIDISEFKKENGNVLKKVIINE